MAIDMFLNIQDKKIKGECADKAHPDTIQVLTWKWQISRNLDGRLTGGQLQRGRPILSELTFTKWVDRASPMLLDALGTAAVFKDAKLILRKSGGGQLEYMTYTLEQVMVSSIHSGASGGEERQLETVTLNFLRLTSSYQGQGADGSKAGGIVEATVQATAPAG